jgi:hypothetical protein
MKRLICPLLFLLLETAARFRQSEDPTSAAPTIQELQRQTTTLEKRIAVLEGRHQSGQPRAPTPDGPSELPSFS